MPLKSIDKSYRFFLTGECHLKKDYPYTLSVFQELYKSHQVRKIILEFPQEFEFGFNKYILDPAPKESDYLDLFTTQLLKNQEGCKAFLEKIRLFNLSVAEEKEKISIVCPDINRSISYALLSLASSTDPEKINNREIYECFMKIFKLKRRHFENNQYEKAVTIVYQIKNYLDTYENDFRNMYKDDFAAMKKNITSLYNTTLLYQTHKTIPDSIREGIIFQNIFEDYKQKPELGYYGNFGLYHTMLNCYIDDITLGGLQVKKSVAQRLNETQELKNKIITIPYYYVGNDPVAGKCQWKISGKLPLEKEEEEKYRLLSNDTGYYAVPSKDLINSKALEDKFQYLIISSR